MLSITDLNLKNKRVLIREDLNVPMTDGKIDNDRRIDAALPTIQYAIAAGARVMICSHLGRPSEGSFTQAFSLAPVAQHLAERLGQAVTLAALGIPPDAPAPGEVLLWENLRFNRGEMNNDPLLAKKMAATCDIFVMDAFATAHRRQASTYGVAEFAPSLCAGLLLKKELDALEKICDAPTRPTLAIIGGSKVSSKLKLLHSLIHKVDKLIVGGGIANTFIAAAGFSVGKSLYEPDLVSETAQLLAAAKQANIAIPLPIDVVVAKQCTANAHAQIKLVSEVASDEMILDIGPQTLAEFTKIVGAAKTILWNGPVGVFEIEAFANGTHGLALAIAGNKQALTVAGGGDTLSAIDKWKLSENLSYISTGGGAFLEYLEGRPLAVIELLKEGHHAKTN
jgi:phosphoglycerate kinase